MEHAPHRPYRLIALDASAPGEPSSVARVRPPLERLLRAGVRVVVIGAADAVYQLGHSLQGPHRTNLALVVGARVITLDGSLAPERDQAAPLARWIVAAFARPHGIAPSDVLLAGARVDDDGAGVALARTERGDVAPLLAAQAALHPVSLPAWIESGPDWHLCEAGFVITREHEIESIFALGNGYVGTRGSLAEGSPLSSPATFVAGIYERPSGRVPELLTLPDWAKLAGGLDGAPLRLERGEILAHRRVLDMRDGILWREWRHRDEAGRVTRIRGLRLASQSDRHLLLQSVTLTPENYTGTLHVESLLSGPRVYSTSYAKTVALSIASFVETPARFDRWTDGRSAGTPIESFDLEVRIGQTYRLDRVLAVYTSRDRAEPEEEATRHLDRVLDTRGVEGIVHRHRDAWHDVWRSSDVIIEGDDYAQTAIRFAIYHLTSSIHPHDEAVSIGARGLSGQSYKGHVFWDTEVFMLPFFVLTRPLAARTVLMYRHRTLGAARERAQKMGFSGALYAWESADTGEDVTPPFVLAPDGELVPVLAGTQEQHISADVAWAVASYWDATEDQGFLLEAGLEIMIETARFWASRVQRGDDDRYHILCVMGPDEYHDSVDDNAYTNGMAQWNLERAADLVALASARWPAETRALMERLGLDASEPERWRSIARDVYLGLDPATGLIEQFRGFFEREDIDLSAHEPRDAPIDVMLGRERVQGSQINKQPDVLMLVYLLWDRFPAHVREACFRYYEPRCAHGSSLSPPIHAALAARLGHTELALRYFRQTAEIDLANDMGNASGGVHLAALGGLWQAAVMGFAGLRALPDGPVLEPRLPPSWRALRFGIGWRGRRIEHALPEHAAEAMKEVRP